MTANETSLGLRIFELGSSSSSLSSFFLSFMNDACKEIVGMSS